MADIKRHSAFYAKVKINKVELKQEEVKNILMEFYLGNIMSKLILKINSNRREVIENSIVEMSIIDVEIGITNDKNVVIDKKVGRYFLAKSYLKGQQGMPKAGDEYIEIIGITDAYKYLGSPEIKALSTEEKSPVFLSKTSGEGSGARGTGTIKIEIKDNLTSSAHDKQFWMQNDQTGIETVNKTLARVVKTPESGGGGGKYNTNANEWVSTSCIDFTEEGLPVVYFYDVKLRARSFGIKSFKDGRKAFFSFKGESPTIVYRDAQLDIKGADYSAKYWQRSSFAYDIEENTQWFRKTRHPYLFEDSAPYTDQMDFDGNGTIPSEMPIFRSTQRMKHENYNTNMYSRYYVDQKVQYAATMLSLRKINIKMTFMRDFFNITPIDICQIEYELGKQDEKSEPNKKLSGKYMVTHVAFEYDTESVNTYVVGSRDSWIK